MDAEKFLAAYNEPRNGTDNFYKHWAVPSFAYSDGVRECANEGVAWLVDLCATELPKVIRASGESLASLHVAVKKSQAKLTLSGSEDVPLPWKKNVGWTDLPDGAYDFLIADETGQFRMLLISEY